MKKYVKISAIIVASIFILIIVFWAASSSIIRWAISAYVDNNSGTESSTNNSESGQYKNMSGRERILTWMESKYGEKFEYVEPYDEGFQNRDSILVAPETNPNLKIHVISGKDKSGGYYFQDNYPSLKYENQVREFLKEMMLRGFSDAVVFYTPSMDVLPAETAADISFEDYLKNSGIILNATILVKDSEISDDTRAERVARQLIGTAPLFNLNIAAFAENIPKEMSKTDVDRRMSYGDYLHCVRIFTNNYDSRGYEVKWEEGTKR